MSRALTPRNRSSEGPLLSVRDLSVTFRGRSGQPSEVVKSLSFDLEEQGSLAVVGESGSGKTVSMRALLKLLPETADVSGTAVYDGQDLFQLDPEALRAVRGQEIGVVFQNAMEALNPTATLKRQLTEHLLWHRVCSKREATARAIEALDRVGIPEPRRRLHMYPFQLSGGMRQRAMIAMAIAPRPRILIADEPTTAVDVTLQRQVLDLLRDLRNDGLALIMITHDLGVARYSCDDVVVMRHGEVVEKGSMKTFAETAEAPYSLQLLDAAIDVETDEAEAPQARGARDRSAPDEALAATPTSTSTTDILVARDLRKVFEGRGGEVRAVDDVQLSLARGETIGIVGESGSGKSTLARLLMRLLEPTDGEIFFDGTDMRDVSGPRLREMRQEFQMVFQNPYGSLLPHMSVAANVAEPLRVNGIGTSRERRRRAMELLESVGIPPERADFYPRQFSGGQQQRVAIARALALSPKVLVCDEPTSALDVSIQAQVLDLLAEVQERLNLAMVFVTHNLAVAQRLSDRIMVMAEGHVVESAPAHDLFRDPRHPYTRTLLAAVLPVRGEPQDWAEQDTVDVTSGELTLVAPDHWVRLSNPEPASPPAGTIQHHEGAVS